MDPDNDYVTNTTKDNMCSLPLLKNKTLRSSSCGGKRKEKCLIKPLILILDI